jgi:hypothetical protein
MERIKALSLSYLKRNKRKRLNKKILKVKSQDKIVKIKNKKTKNHQNKKIRIKR